MATLTTKKAAPRVTFPEKLAFLFDPHRYKVAYGGRGAAKSWNFARAIILRCAKQETYVLCARQVQKSIKDSVHQLLKNQIKLMGMDKLFDVLETEIRCKRTGSKIIFAGLQYGLDNIPSLEGIDICWVEEARTVTKASWNKLIPTIRKEGSEIWVSFNPELDTDETYVRFIKKQPPPDSKVVKISYADNPWLPKPLLLEAKHLKDTDPDEFHVIYGGNCRRALLGAIYEKELRAAEAAGHICRVPYNPAHVVDTIWDLGRSDATSIWFRQRVGFEWHFIDFLEGYGHHISWYFDELAKKPYSYGRFYLPHDAKAKQLGSKLTIEEQALERIGDHQRLIIGKNFPGAVEQGINAARTIFPLCWFDEDKCSDGLNFLRRYVYDIDPKTGQRSKSPKHDENCHAADAFRYHAMNTRLPDMRPDFSQWNRQAEEATIQGVPVLGQNRHDSGSWMG